MVIVVLGERKLAVTVGLSASPGGTNATTNSSEFIQSTNRKVNRFHIEFQVDPAQCRAARALLDWTQADLMDRCGASQKTIADFEGGLTRPYRRTLDSITAAFEAAGVDFINRGVRMRSSAKRPRPTRK
jgi:DNA-binding XRE family transcriptional regulator